MVYEFMITPTSNSTRIVARYRCIICLVPKIPFARVRGYKIDHVGHNSCIHHVIILTRPSFSTFNICTASDNRSWERGYVRPSLAWPYPTGLGLETSKSPPPIFFCCCCCWLLLLDLSCKCPWALTRDNTDRFAKDTLWQQLRSEIYICWLCT